MIKLSKTHTIAIILFSIIFSLPMLRSGIMTNEGLRLVGVNGTDGIWNLALIEELKNHFPPEHPGFAGMPLRGYHFLYHLLLAVISKITFISPVNLYFHIFPLIISFIWGYGVYSVVYSWFKNKMAAIWSVFLSFFGGSFAYFLPIIWKQNLNIDSAFGICQPNGCSIVNPAFASSIALLVWSIFFLNKFLKTSKRKWAILLILTSGLSIGFKVYAGMILMGALLISALWRLIYYKRLDMFFIFFGALILSLLVFLPFNANYGFLVYQPLWPPHRVMQGPLNFTRWDELWEQYEYYQNLYGILKLEVWANTVFFFGNIGTRIIALALILKASKKKLIKVEAIYFLSMLAISYLVPMFFIQPSGGVFNMIQFYWYFLFMLSIVAGPAVIVISEKIKHKALLVIFYAGFILLTLPSAFSVSRDTLLTKGGFIDVKTMDSFKFLKSYKDYDKTVLEIPKNDLYSVPVIAAFGGKRMYIANEIAMFHYEDKERRLQVIDDFMRPQNLCENDKWDTDACKGALLYSNELLIQEKISLIYTNKNLYWLDNWDKVKLIYKNSKEKIYKTNL